MKITFEKNTNQKKNPNVEQKQEYILPLLHFALLAKEKKYLPEILW